VRVLSIFGVVEASKVYIRITANMDVIRRRHDEPFTLSASEVSANKFESQAVMFGGLERVSSTLMDSKRNVWMSVTGKIKEHPDYTRIVDGGIRRFTVSVFWKRSCFGWGVFLGCEACVKTKGVENRE
jgi:hypothetical protein